MAQVQDIVCTNPELSEKLEFMWNNQEFSDVLFLVNDVQFHASSHLVSVTSNVLKTMLDTHFKHCGHREIRIGSIKHDESFSVILKYIYGMGINFSQMDRAVLCEVLCQSERFELARFAKELKSYMSKLECFELDSAVILLNTAKKFELKDLYEKLAIFTFKNAAQFVKHESFVKYAPPPSINSQIENEVVKKSESPYIPICRNIRCENLFRITRKFTVKYKKQMDVIDGASKEVFTIGGLEWKVHMYNSKETDIHLICRCTGDKDIEWQCATECQVRMISNSLKYPTRVLPDFTNGFAYFLKANFHNKCTSVMIGKYNDTKRPEDWKTGYLQNEFYTIEVHFQYIHKTVMETKQIM